MSDRQGVEIDYCSQCRGVWLDRGELDKIIEREAAISSRGASRGTASAPFSSPPARQDDDRSRRDDDRGRWDHDDDDSRRGRRKRGWLSEMFDFD
jgi:Zn-finger nucleic acid-binding protein